LGLLQRYLGQRSWWGATNSITVVDPETAAVLQAKAPTLWATLSASPRFEHVQASGNDVLPEIRKAYSKVWTRKLYALATPLYQAEKGTAPPAALMDVPNLDLDAYYDLRRDAEGIPMNRAARQWAPGPSTAQTGLAHLLLIETADGRDGSWYIKAGQKIRVIHGAGEGLTTVKGRFNEPPTAPRADIVVCVGAMDQGVPGSIVSKGTPNGVVRSSPGAGSRQNGARPMTDALSGVHVVMQTAGYRTWDIGGSKIPTIAFEDEATMGFVCAFATPRAMIEGWRETEATLLGRHAPLFRMAGDKAWDAINWHVRQVRSHRAQVSRTARGSWVLNGEAAGVESIVLLHVHDGRQTADC